MRIFFFFLFSSTAIFASVSVPFRMEYSTGYLQEYLHWQSLSDTPAETVMYQEKYKNLKFWENELTLDMTYRDLYWFIEGGYGCFGRGALKNYFDLISNTAYFSSNTTAGIGKITGLFGYSINLTPGRVNQWILTPTIGYSGFWKKFHHKTFRPETLYLTPVPDGYVLYGISSVDSHALKEDFHGFCLGGNADVRSDKNIFSLAYSFYWLLFDHQSWVQYDLLGYTAGPVLSSLERVTKEEDGKKLHGYAHRGKLEISYQFSHHFEGGLIGQVLYFASDHDHISKKIVTESLIPAGATAETTTRDQFKLDGWDISFLAGFSYLF